MYAKEWLTEKGFRGQEPLFENGSKLAERIFGLKEKSKFKGSKSTITTYINQFFKSGTPLPATLVDDILFVTDLELEKRPEELRLAWKKRIQRAIRGLSLIEPWPDVVDLYEDTLVKAEKTQDHCIVSSVRWGDRIAGELYEFRELIGKRLRLGGMAVDPLSSFAMPTYTLFVPTLRSGQMVWRSIYEEALQSGVQRFGLHYDEELLIDAVRSLAESGAIRIFAIGKTHCLTPMLVFEPLAQNRAGFITYNKETKFSILPIPEDYLQRWVELLYEPVLDGDIGNEVKFDSVVAEIQVHRQRSRQIMDAAKRLAETGEDTLENQ